MSASSFSEDDVVYNKRPRINVNTTCSSTARKSKIILRKARLQLNQKLLKQLRQPSRYNLIEVSLLWRIAMFLAHILQAAAASRIKNTFPCRTCQDARFYSIFHFAASPTSVAKRFQCDDEINVSVPFCSRTNQGG